jgi:mRNA interferase HigB
MHVITRRHLKEAGEQYPDAAKEIQAWYTIVKQAKWRSFVDVRQTFKDADNVDQYVVFNIRHNQYRLITSIHYCREREGRLTEGHVYIRSFLTHKQYDNRKNWDKGVKKK